MLHSFRLLTAFGLQIILAAPLLAQRPSFGILIGPSLVGGGDSRVSVGPGVMPLSVGLGF